jgi:WD40 repeat protein
VIDRHRRVYVLFLYVYANFKVDFLRMTNKIRMPHIFFPFIWAATLMFVCFGAPMEAVSSSAPPGKYHPVRIAEGVPAKPGMFAWSPDGSKIVFSGKTIGIYDTADGKIEQVNIKASFATWYGNDTVLAISGEAGMNILNRVNVADLALKKIGLDINPDAVFASSDGKTVLLLESRIRVMLIGTGVGYSLFVYDMRNGLTRKIYDSDIIYPTRQPNIDLLHAWFHAGLNRSGNLLLLMEQVRPPAMIRPFTRVIGIESVTGRRQPITGRETGKTYISGDWSPDGSSVVLTDADGHMEIYGLKNGLEYTDDALYGLYPSWNPRGGLIYLGGSVIDADGSQKEDIFAGSHESLAEWSPDGTKLLVAAGNKLWLLDGFDPHFIKGKGDGEKKTLP